MENEEGRQRIPKIIYISPSRTFPIILIFIVIGTIFGISFLLSIMIGSYKKPHMPLVKIPSSIEIDNSTNEEKKNDLDATKPDNISWATPYNESLKVPSKNDSPSYNYPEPKNEPFVQPPAVHNETVELPPEWEVKSSGNTLICQDANSNRIKWSKTFSDYDKISNIGSVSYAGQEQNVVCVELYRRSRYSTSGREDEKDATVYINKDNGALVPESSVFPPGSTIIKNY